MDTINTMKLVVAETTEETRYFVSKECASAVHPAHNLVSDRQYTVLATVQFPNIHSIVAVHEAPSSVSAILSCCRIRKKRPVFFCQHLHYNFLTVFNVWQLTMYLTEISN